MEFQGIFQDGLAKVSMRFDGVNLSEIGGFDGAKS